MTNPDTLPGRIRNGPDRGEDAEDAPAARYPELLRSLLNAVSRAYAEGQGRGVRRYGLTVSQAEQIAAMSAHDLHALSQGGAGLFHVKVNADALDDMLDRLAEGEKEDRLLDRLLMLDAPAQMMQRMFGLTAAECATRRKVLGITASTGRPRAPTEEEEQSIWSTWRSARGLSPAQRLETVAAETGLPLNLIWSQVRRWEREGSDPDKLPEDRQPAVHATADTSATNSAPAATPAALPAPGPGGRLADLRARLLHRPDSEGEQTLIRLAVSILLIGYYFAVASIDDYHAALAPEQHRLMLSGIGILLVWPVSQLLWLLADPRGNVVRRSGGLVYDVAALTWFMWFLGQFGGLMYMIYLWIIIGHGLRFGIPHLLAATALSVTGFGLVLYGNGFWHSHLGLGIGLIAGLAAVPLYTWSLIRAMAQSKLRAHRSRLSTVPVPPPDPEPGAVHDFPRGIRQR